MALRWSEVVGIAHAYAVEHAGNDLRINGRVVARHLPAEDAVLFSLGDDEKRERVIQCGPFYVTASVETLPAVLGKLGRLTREHVVQRLARFAVKPQGSPATMPVMGSGLASRVRGSTPPSSVVGSGPRCYLLTFTRSSLDYEPGVREKRRFARVASSTLVDFLAACWRSVKARGDWDDSYFKGQERVAFDSMFADVLDEQRPFPTSRKAMLECLRESIDAEATENFAHSIVDDDEGTYVEYFLFDTMFLAEQDALDRLPHPSRGQRREPDRYDALLARLRAPRSKTR